MEKAMTANRKDMAAEGVQVPSALGEAIGSHVLHALGRPEDFRGVKVHFLWEGHYRVNVLVGRDATSYRVANSFFLVVDDGGNVLASTPKVERRY